MTPAVLIPRYDTEVLVREALAHAKPGMQVLDLCTGSGCILLTVLAETEGCTGTGTDISEAALAVAEENAKRLGIGAQFIRSDVTCGIIDGRYDLILSNPPYIKSGDIEGLAREVRDHEPYAALDGGPDGLHFYRKIIADAPLHLNEDGFLILEAGADTAEAVRDLADRYFDHTELIRDLAGLPRVVTATGPKKHLES